MICPHCGKGRNEVIDTRISNDTIRRRRVCWNCHQRFSTYEILKDDYKRLLNCKKVVDYMAKVAEVTLNGGTDDGD
jgi:transcriptional repressor NrdR